MKLILSILLFGSVSWGQIISPSNIRTYKQFRNYIQNPDAEYNVTTGVTQSASITTRNTTSPINGVAQFAIDSTSSGQTVKFRLNNLPEKFAANNGEATFRYYNEPGTATGDYKWYIENSSGTKVSPETKITTSGAYPIESPKIIFNPGTTLNQPYYLVFESIVSNATAMFVDDIYAGDVTSIGQFSSVSGENPYTPTFTGFGTVSNVAMKWQQIGSKILITGRFTAGTTTNVEGRVSLPNNLISAASPTITTLENVGIYTRGNTSVSHGGTLMIEPSSSYFVFSIGGVFGSENISAHTKGLVSTQVSGGSEVIFINALIPVQGLSASQSAAAANQTDYGWTSYTPTFTGFGTVTTHSCWHSRISQNLFLQCNFTVGTPTSVEARVSLPNSLVISPTVIPSLATVGRGARNVSNAESQVILAEPSVSYVTFGVGASGVTALGKQLGNVATSTGNIYSFTAVIPIQGWEPNGRAPTLIGSVTSNSVGAEAIERVSFGGASEPSSCTGSPCTAYRKSVGITSVTRTGTGAYSVNFPSGLFSATPTCLCSMSMISTNVFCGKNQAGTFSPTRFDLWILNSSTTLSDGAADIICMGPR